MNKQKNCGSLPHIDPEDEVCDACLQVGRQRKPDDAMQPGQHNNFTT